MKRAQGVIIILISIMAVLTLLKIYLLIDLAVDAHIYVSLIEDRKQMELENLVLENELLYYESYQYIMGEARREGYVDARYMLLR